MVVAASAVAAIASAGGGLFGPAPDLHPDWMRIIRIGAGAAVVLGLVAMLLLRDRSGPAVLRREGPPGGAMLKAAAIMAVVALITLMRPDGGTGSNDEDDGGLAGPGGTRMSADAPLSASQPPPPPTSPMTRGLSEEGSVLEPDGSTAPPLLPPPPPTPDQPDQPEPPSTLESPVDWSGLLRQAGIFLLALLALGLVVLTYLALSGRVGEWDDAAEGEAPDGAPTGAPEAEEGILASIEEISRPGGEPRALITAAYLRLLAALDDAGASRAPHEAPHEHLNRALGPLGVAPEPLHRLAALYVIAQFSEHPVTEGDRRQAAEALQASLADLRARGEGLVGVGA